MCGIFGMSYGPGGSGDEAWTPTEFAELMFPAIVHRGPHAFGWMSYNPETGITIVKHEGKVTTKANRAKINLDDDAQWFVGHVRYATNGSPSYHGNNHPLTHGKVVGVHNGVLRGWEPIIAETGREDEQAEVDSEAIFAAIHKWGITEGLKRIDGNMVTVFAETAHPEVLHIARTYGRPLVYTTTPNGSLIFASECCVIDACGIEGLPTPTDFTGRFRHLTISGGLIIAREQYKADPVPGPSRAAPDLPFGWPSPARLGRGKGRSDAERGGVRGITDYFDKGSKSKGRSRADDDILERLKRGPSRGARPANSLDEPEYTTEGTPIGARAADGGEYIGAGWYRTPDGVMTVEAYVEWAVRQRMARMEHEAAMDAAADFEAAQRAIERGE